jgi:hypothetical protein
MEQTLDPMQGPSWLYGQWRKVFEGLNRQKILLSAQRLAEVHPRDDMYRLARRVIRRSARQSAVLGVVAASPSILPGLGTSVSLLAVVPEERALIRKTCIMLLEVAAIYGFDPTDEERLYEIVALAGAPQRALKALVMARGDIRRVAVKVISLLGWRSGRGGVMAGKAVGRLPMLGFLLGGAVNFISMKTVGRKALWFYQRQYEQALQSNQMTEEQDGSL